MTKQPPKKRRGQIPGSLHIDKRAARVLADPMSDGDADELLSTKQVSEWIDYSTQWLEIARNKGTGPRFLRNGPQEGYVPARQRTGLA